MEESFDAVPSPSAEQKKGIGCWIHLQLIFNDADKAIYGLPHIGSAALSLYQHNAAYPHRIIILILSKSTLFYNTFS